MDTMTIAITGSLIISLFVAFVFVLMYKERFHYYMGKDDKWSFKDWAGPLTATAASLSLILALTQGNPAITGLSIICGASVILMPTAYQACSPSKGRVWLFLSFTALTLCAVTTQLVVAALLADDSLIKAVPANYIHVFRGLMGLAALIALIYYCRSTFQTIENQSYTTAKDETAVSRIPKADTVALAPTAVSA